MKIREWLDCNGRFYTDADTMAEVCAKATGRTIKSVKEVLREYEYVNPKTQISPLATSTIKVKPVALSDCKEITFGIASDLHFGSKECQITALNEFCEIAKASGVKHILVPGDICAGSKVYAGQDQDIYAGGAEAQEQSVLANLPEGFEWYMLAGNHDYDFVKRSGHNPVESLALRRNDIHYIGNDLATLPLLEGVDAQLWHPSGGVPYSYSYRLQKGVEALGLQYLHDLMDHNNSKVRFFIAGHLHIQMQGMFGKVFGCQAGAFEGTTNYLKRKGYYSSVGGYIVKATLKAGDLLQFEAPFYMFPEIKDDYKNYNHSYSTTLNLTPILG